jgi:hypothetical protein
MKISKTLTLALISLALTACVLPAPPSEFDIVTLTPVSTDNVDTVEPEITPDFVLTDDTIPEFPPTATVKPDKPVTPSGNDFVETTQTPVITQEPYRFTIQAGTPAETINFIYPEAGCNWLGVGGQVFNKEGFPMDDMIVEVSGELAGESLVILSMTGETPQLGPGGYVIQLASKPISSEGTLWLQLYDLDGSPLANKYSFDTYDGELACENNLIIMNFNEIIFGLDNKMYLPQVFQGAS